MAITRSKKHYTATSNTSKATHDFQQSQTSVKLENEPQDSPNHRDSTEERFFDCDVDVNTNSGGDLSSRQTETDDDGADAAFNSKGDHATRSKDRKRKARSSFFLMSRVVKILGHSYRRKQLKFHVMWNGLLKPMWEIDDFMLQYHSEDVAKYLIDLQAHKIKSFNPLVDRHHYLGDLLTDYLDNKKD